MANWKRADSDDHRIRVFPIRRLSNINPDNPGDPNDIRADFNLGDFQLEPGMHLNVTDGTTARSLTISSLQVTGIDVVNDTVTGTTEPDAWVHVCANIPNNCVTRWVQANSSGDWTADFQIAGEQDDDQATVDLLPGSNGWASQYDEEPNQTYVDWWVPNPYVEANVGSHWVHGREWPVGSELTLTVAGTEFFRHGDY